MSEWREVRLGNFFKVKHGFAFKGKGITTDKTSQILVTPGNFHIGGGFKTDKFKYYIGEFPPDYLLKENDIIITMTDLSKDTDTLGYSAKVPYTKGIKYLHNQRIGLVQFKNNDADSDFLYWLMRTRDYQGYIVGSASGTSIMHTSPTRTEDYQFKIPPLPEQKAIAEVLSSLDDKIDLLHRQNKTLEQMAETLFRQWFVEEDGEDWEEYNVTDIANHIKENVKPASNPLLIYRHYSLPAFDNGEKPVIEIGKEILSNKYVVPPKTILVSKLNPRVPRIWAIPNEIDENSICSTEFQVFQPKKESYYGFLCFLFKSDEAVGELEMAASGTSGSHQRVKPQDILNITFMIPTFHKVEEYSQEVKPLIEKQQRNNDYIRTLESLRDTLLPKLMSGEIRVKYDKEAK